MGLCPAEDAARVHRHFGVMGMETQLQPIQGVVWSPRALLKHMGKDKKVKDGRMTFVLVRGIGQAFLSRDVMEEDILATLEEATVG
jgi:3-dehydroquinate synthase